MSIREIVAKSTLSKGSRPKTKAAPLNWNMTSPQVPGEEPDEVKDEVSAAAPQSNSVANFGDQEIVDNFILGYFALFGQNNEPSDAQLHALAESLGVAPEEFERHIYNMLTRIAGDEIDIDTQDL